MPQYGPKALTRNDLRVPGEQLILRPDKPAAGAEISLTVPGGKQWRMLVGGFTLVTSAVVANRTPTLRIRTAQGEVLWQSSAPAQAASITQRYGLRGTNQVSAPVNLGNQIVHLVPDEWFRDGVVIDTVTTNIDVGDQYSLIALQLDEVWYADNDLEHMEHHWAMDVHEIGGYK